MKRLQLVAFTALMGFGLVAADAAMAKCSPIAAGGKGKEPAYVYFATGSSALGPEARKTITEQASLAKAQYAQKICITGTADKQGDPAANERLSKARANAVAAEMAKQGVAKSVLETQWTGEPGGSFLGSTGGARADRRVEIRVTR